LTEGDGYAREFDVRDNLVGAPYNVSLEGRHVVVEYSGTTILSSTAATDTTGTVETGTTNKVTNQQGTLNVTQP